MAKRLTPEEKAAREAAREHQREISRLEAKVSNHWWERAGDIAFLGIMALLTTPFGAFIGFFVFMQPKWEKQEAELEATKAKLTALRATAP